MNMRFRLQWAAASALIITAGCQAEGRFASSAEVLGGTAALDSDVQKASYSIGREIGASFAPTQEFFDLDALIRGIEDALADADMAIPMDSLLVARARVGETVQESSMAAQQQLIETNGATGEAFLAENATKEGIIVTESGLQYEVLTQGDGPQPTAESRVRVHYRGTLIDGTEFDSSYARDEPTEFGVNGVIPGFGEGLQLMAAGSHYRFFIPANIAYGLQAAGSVIGPNSTLIFEVELQEIL
jgi:FKBP-type peptidyl-prolyl cis-trans isomerase